MSGSTNNWEIIRWHAGFLYEIEPALASEQVALSETIWRVKRGESVDLMPSVRHLMDELQKANLIINGPVPSETIGPDTNVPGELAYAVSNLITQCIELSASEERSTNSKEFAAWAWKLSCAWDGVLAGDIDDVVENVEIEASARGITTRPC
jgi:hypothetical protein